MYIKTNLLEEYVNFVNNTKKQNKYFKIIIFLNTIFTVLFLFFVLLKNYNRKLLTVFLYNKYKKNKQSGC